MPLRSLASGLLMLLTLSACAVPQLDQPAPQTGAPSGAPLPTQPSGSTVKPESMGERLDSRTVARNFIAVVNAVEPVAERECRARAPGFNCDFQIVVDDRNGQPPNAFQTVDSAGRPIIAFTLSLLGEARNRDELAFVMAHEAAHHISGHLTRQAENANVGATVFGELAGALGATGEEQIRVAQQLGAAVGARSYSKSFELEADELGAIIAARAGYDPLLGADFFFRIPDPGDRFLGTHPPNAERIERVRQTAARL